MEAAGSGSFGRGLGAGSLGFRRGAGWSGVGQAEVCAGERGGGPIGLGRAACRQFGGGRLPGLERLERAQAAGELGERRAAVAQERREGAGAVAVAGQDAAEIGLAALVGEQLGLDPVGAREAPGGDRDALREHGLERAGGRQLLEQGRLEGPEPGAVLVRQHDEPQRPQAVLERILRRARLALGRPRPARHGAIAAAGLGARSARGDGRAERGADTGHGGFPRWLVNGRGRTEEREPERSFYAVIGIMSIAAVEPRLRCRALLARPHGGSHQRCGW